MKQEHWMKLAVLGETHVSVIPRADNKEIMKVTIVAEHRKDSVSMETNKDETVDQFTVRMKSMIRSLLNAENREGAPVNAPEDKANLTWEEQKNLLKAKK